MGGFGLDRLVRSKGVLLAVAAVLIVGLLGLGAAVGHDTLGDEKYIRKVERLLAGDEATAAAQAHLLEQIWSADPTVGINERVRLSEEYFQTVEAQLGTAVAELSDLNLTHRVARTNVEIVWGLENAEATTGEVIALLPEVQSEVMLETVFFIYVEGFGPLLAPCRELQAVAGEIEVSTELACEAAPGAQEVQAPVSFDRSASNR